MTRQGQGQAWNQNKIKHLLLCWKLRFRLRLGICNSQGPLLLSFFFEFSLGFNLSFGLLQFYVFLYTVRFC